MTTPETRFKTALRSKIRQIKPSVVIQAISSRFTNGYPDWILYDNAVALPIEIKVHPNKTTALQEKIISDLRHVGINAIVLTKYKGHFHINHVRGTKTIISLGELANWILNEAQRDSNWVQTPYSNRP